MTPAHIAFLLGDAGHSRRFAHEKAPVREHDVISPRRRPLQRQGAIRQTQRGRGGWLDGSKSGDQTYPPERSTLLEGRTRSLDRQVVISGSGSHDNNQQSRRVQVSATGRAATSAMFAAHHYVRVRIFAASSEATRPRCCRGMVCFGELHMHICNFDRYCTICVDVCVTTHPSIERACDLSIPNGTPTGADFSIRGQNSPLERQP